MKNKSNIRNRKSKKINRKSKRRNIKSKRRNIKSKRRNRMSKRIKIKNIISFKNLEKFSKKFNKVKTNKIFKNVNTKNKFKNLIIKADYIQKKHNFFEKSININTKPTDQLYSGRCWIFAFLNVLRLPMIKKYKIEDFEFSQNYLFFYDKLEKANFFLDFIIKNKNTRLTDTKLIYMLDNLTNDGGQWNTFVNLIEKYGIIPKTIMDDHFHSKNTDELKNFYNNFLRKAAHKIRTSNVKNIDNLKNNILSECYKILVIFLGEPPKKINWEYYKKKKNKKIYSTVENITPLEFYKKYVPYNCNDLVCLINSPCKEMPLYNLYNVDTTFNVVGGTQQNFINVPMNIIVDSIKKSIDNDEAIWTAIDSDKFISNKHGFFDFNAFNYKDIFGFNNIMDKCDSLDYRQACPKHAVVIRGYNLKNKNNKGFLLENSWGKEYGFDGNYYMNIDWFKNYAYEFVINKKYVPKNIVEILNKKPILLPYNSPFGSLMVK